MLSPLLLSLMTFVMCCATEEQRVNTDLVAEAVVSSFLRDQVCLHVQPSRVGPARSPRIYNLHI